MKDLITVLQYLFYGRRNKCSFSINETNNLTEHILLEKLQYYRVPGVGSGFYYGFVSFNNK